MKLSQMVSNNQNTEELELEVPTTENNEQSPEGHIQSTVDDEQRGTAADVSEDELEFIKNIANPERTSITNTTPTQENDTDTQAELDAMKALVS